ncbi:MAG TPA: sodium:solute symporter, partial [Gimesia maris]|nr:sodium:solute symporter [Gimesia maris]
MRSELLASVSFSLELADWLVLGLYLISMLAVGIYFSKRASQSADGFLIADRNLPWWVIGFSNVSTYSDAGGAWVWIFFFGGFMYLNKIAWISWSIWMPLVCIFWAKMWRRSQLVTTGELIEFRYSGKVAGWFRGFYGAYACLVWA